MKEVIEIQLFPCIDYFKIVEETKHIKIEQYESFQKMSFRNRYVIAGANGIQSLTVPLAGGREQKKLITDVEIDFTEDWQTKHWRSINSSYSKAPFFIYYADKIKELLFSNEKKLFYYNLEILKWLCKVLKIDTELGFTENFSVNYESETDGRNMFLPNNFQLKRENWKPIYPQVFEDRLGFQPNLSILDLLFCEGPNAGNLIKKAVKYKDI